MKWVVLMRIVLIAMMLVIVSLNAGLAKDGTVARLHHAFDTWLGEHDAKGVLAVFKGKRFEGHAAFGLDPDTPVETASLSKAITGVCVAELVRAGQIAWDDTLADILGQGPQVTVAALLTHTSGLGPDTTQSGMRGWFGRPANAALEVLDNVTGRDLAGDPGTYLYNNENYALLGLIIERTTGRPYDEVCFDRALASAGAEGALSPLTASYAAFGGWSLTVSDYARFVTHWFGPNGAIGQNPFALPEVHMGGGAYYGTGMVFRKFQGGHNFWHFGAICLPGLMEIGSYAVTFKGDWTLVAAYEACVDWDAMAALDGALARAVFQP